MVGGWLACSIVDLVPGDLDATEQGIWLDKCLSELSDAGVESNLDVFETILLAAVQESGWVKEEDLLSLTRGLRACRTFVALATGPRGKLEREGSNALNATCLRSSVSGGVCADLPTGYRHFSVPLLRIFAILQAAFQVNNGGIDTCANVAPC